MYIVKFLGIYYLLLMQFYNGKSDLCCKFYFVSYTLIVLLVNIFFGEPTNNYGTTCFNFEVLCDVQRTISLRLVTY